MAGQLEFGLSRKRERVALTVTQLVRVVRETLETQIDEYWVSGEVSNARRAPSNHLYFTLKDARSAINVVMFNTAARRLQFRLEDGMRVVMRGRVSLYETRGALQFYAEEVEPRGLGALQLAFEQLRERLKQEGLFDAALKRPLPLLPRTVGIVTALGSAALRDMMRLLFDRFPNLQVIIAPSAVQGAGAAAGIVRALEDLNHDGRAEVIIVGRGGGSLEDLWPFNEEIVARAIRRSRIPVVSAVGHEIDYTIADFAADLRAPTPSAAAQLTVPDKADLRRRIDQLHGAMATALRAALAAQRRQVAHLGSRMRDPHAPIRDSRQRLDEAAAALARACAAQSASRRALLRQLATRLTSPLAIGAATGLRRNAVRTLQERLWRALRSRRDAVRARLNSDMQRLDAVSPLRVLDRGYAVVTRRLDAAVVTDVRQVEVDDEIGVRLANGRLLARILTKSQDR
ncbi:MAG TPA: exodeoxyribonuclease VII large subunit [Candidatus Binataceae bacterium]|jgi:exodeoxyribonuclease VII large subunit|nr:exodeoxyribonuclease VII large subunit [Candidatus Binataceae bacterium]